MRHSFCWIENVRVYHGMKMDSFARYQGTRGICIIGQLFVNAQERMWYNSFNNDSYTYAPISERGNWFAVQTDQWRKGSSGVTSCWTLSYLPAIKYISCISLGEFLRSLISTRKSDVAVSRRFVAWLIQSALVKDMLVCSKARRIISLSLTH